MSRPKGYARTNPVPGGVGETDRALRIAHLKKIEPHHHSEYIAESLHNIRPIDIEGDDYDRG
eukprot:749183-Pyramimonas_sp.AAC.1